MKVEEAASCSDSSLASGWIDVDRIRQDFPALSQKVHGHPLIYLDNAASSQKPECVIDAVSAYYRADNANVHRGVHELSQRATAAYEGARDKIRRFIGAAQCAEIILTKGTTEAINLVASTFGQRIQAGDRILITEMEHHSNIVPWQILCQMRAAHLDVIPIDDRGDLILEEAARLLELGPKLLSLSHISNALGTINPVADLIGRAHQVGALVLVDGAQAVPHSKIDVQALDCDFYSFSSHKMFGPTGVGVLYGKRDVLEGLPPYQGGGDMILSVSFDGTTYNSLPHRLEAGTPNMAGVIGLGAAVDYLEAIGLEIIKSYESDLLAYASEQLTAVPGLRLIAGEACKRAAVLSLVMDGIHPHDIGTILDRKGIAVRTGHHCAQPVMTHFGIPATARASLALYNTRAEIDRLVEELAEIRRVFGA